MLEKIKKEYKKITKSSYFYYGLIIVASLAIGFYAKSIAARYITAGAEDHLIHAKTSSYSDKEIKQAVEKIRQKALEDQQNAAAAANAEAPAAGGSCGQ